MSMRFIEIVVKYPEDCPEYKGKPYFSILYDEDGELFEGFGTYKPEVLSRDIRVYFMGANYGAKRKRGEWLDEQLALPLSDGSKKCVRCSCCFTHWDSESNFCPNCGADMRGEGQ